MNDLKEIKRNGEIEIIEDCFQKEVLAAGAGCPCTVYVPELKYKVIAAHYIEVDPY